MSTNPTHTPPSTISYTSHPVAVILTLTLIFFLVGVFTIGFCRFFMQNLFYMWHIRHNPSRTPVGRGRESMHHGLDPLIISSFPTFTYSSVKEYRTENYGLECAICLCEFKDDNVLRLLTTCYHVYHKECIDAWLGSHKSCPCCRCSLDTLVNSPEKSPNLAFSPSRHEASESDREDSIAINIKEDTNETIGDKLESTKEKHVVIEVAPDRGEDRTADGIMTRCKSTGHSIVRNTQGRENDYRFMLRLPKDVQEKLIPRHNWTRSCTEFGEYESKTSSNVGFGEVTLERDKH